MNFFQLVIMAKEEGDFMKHILFVCNPNINRSPTFERYFRNVLPKTDWSVRSAGVYFGDDHRVDAEILDWSDAVFVMDLEQYRYIFEKYPEHIKKCSVVGISDQYQPDADDLLGLIKFWKEVFWREECQRLGI